MELPGWWWALMGEPRVVVQGAAASSPSICGCELWSTQLLSHGAHSYWAMEHTATGPLNGRQMVNVEACGLRNEAMWLQSHKVAGGWSSHGWWWLSHG